MATIIVDKFTGSKLTFTATSKYDILVLPEAEGVSTAGQVIASYGDTNCTGLDNDLENFSLSTTLGGGKISIGGNYGNQPTYSVEQQTLDSQDYCPPWSVFNGPFLQKTSADGSDLRSYNIYHVAFNSNDASGGIKFGGEDAQLVLVSQLGAGNARFYASSGNKNLHKIDDNIRMRSEAYGLFSKYDNSGKPLLYAVVGAPARTSSITASFTVYAEKNLTVVSDLAGQLEATAAALHTAYRIPSSDKITIICDAFDKQVYAAAVKAEDLLLSSNFRAVITVGNNQKIFDFALDDCNRNGEPSKKREIDAFTPPKKDDSSSGSDADAGADAGAGAGAGESAPADDEIVVPSGSPNDFTLGGENKYGLDTWGTTLMGAGLDDVDADNSEVISTGVWVDDSLTMAKNTVWAGNITVDTSDVRIIGDVAWRAPSDTKDISVSLDNSTIEAHGIRVDGSLNISVMDEIIMNDDNVTDDDKIAIQTPTITVTAKDNFMYIKPLGKGTASAANTSVKSSGIWTGDLTLGTVTDKVAITVTSANNKFGGTIEAFPKDGFVQTYGIYANTAKFTDFDATITVTSHNDMCNQIAALYMTKSLDAEHRLNGTFEVRGWQDDDPLSANNSYGIWAPTITVDGSINTDIIGCDDGIYNLKFGIYATNITASDFSGSIIAAVGMNVSGVYASDASKVHGDAFDFTGEISAQDGIVSRGQLNLRVSGTINASGNAVLSDVCHDPSWATIIFQDEKHDDKLEIASTADITGNLDLGAGTNIVNISSDASVKGSILTGFGEVNIFFHLEERNFEGKTEEEINAMREHVTVKVPGGANTHSGYHADDKTLKDSFTFTVNLNYATVGETYTLFEYTGNNVAEFWSHDRQIAFLYQGCNGTLTLDKNNLSGEAEIIDTEGNRFGKAQAYFKDNKVYVEVLELSKDKTPVKLVWDYTPEDTAEETNLEQTTHAKYISQTYDKDANTLTLEWNTSGEMLNAADYNLPTINVFEIEYQLFDETGKEVGKSVCVRLDADKASRYTINGVSHNSAMKWRMRLLGDKSANTVSAWSDWKDVLATELTEEQKASGIASTFVAETKSDFVEENFGSSVIDANPRKDTSGVVAAIAELSWGSWRATSGGDKLLTTDHMESNIPIHHYEIEYVMLDKRITVDDIGEGKDLHAYIASEEFFDEKELAAKGVTVYRKTVSGTEVAISNLQNQSFVYWRIKAVDIKGGQSDWVAGDTFRVWSNNDTSKPIFIDKTIGYYADYDIPENYQEPAKLTDKALIGWNAASDTESGVRTYIIEVSHDGGKTFEERAQVAAEQLNPTMVNGVEYDYTYSLEGLTGPSQYYRVIAVDYFGKRSEAISGSFTVDRTAPSFVNESICGVQDAGVDKTNPTAVKLDPVFTWSKAVDGAGEMGVRYYEVRIRRAGSENWETICTTDAKLETFSYQYTQDHANKLDAASYEYEIIAYDYFGSKDVVTGKFGSEDMDAPVGAFDADASKFTGKVVASYTEVYEDRVVTETVEQPDGSIEVIQKVETVLVGKKVDQATVTIKWADDYKDPAGVLYKVTVSDSSFLSGEQNTYSFWTTKEEAAAKTMTFDNSTTGRTASIFNGMKTVYWMVEAYDTNYNAAPELSSIYSFDFKDQNGDTVSNSYAPAQPEIVSVKIENAENEDGNMQAYIDLTWKTPNTLMGIYSYTISIYDSTGKKLLFEKNTADTSEFLTTDLSPKVDMTDNGSSNTFRIKALHDFFDGHSMLPENEYKVIVTAHDNSGRSTKSKGYDFIVDTTCPNRVEIVEASAVVSNMGATAASTLMLRWKALEDASGIDYYLVEYCPEYSMDNAANWKSEKVYDKTEFTLNVKANEPAYVFRVVAYDKSGNRGVSWASDEVVRITPASDHYLDSVTSPTRVSFAEGSDRMVIGVNTDRYGEEYLESVGQGDPADVFSFDVVGGSVAISLTAEELSAVFGTNKALKIDIYEGSNVKKAWKSYTVKDDSRVFSDLLLQNDTTYTFKVTNTQTKTSVSTYKFIFDKTQLGNKEAATGYLMNNTRDNTLSDIKLENEAFQKAHSITMEAETGAVQSFNDWVGFGDTADVRLLEVTASGRYNFTLKDVAAAAKLTVYQVVNGKTKSIGTVSASQKNIDGVVSKDLVLEAGGRYFIEVKPTNAKAYGTEYAVDIECVESYPAATTDDDLFGANAKTLTVGGTVENGYVGTADKMDIFKLVDCPAGDYQLKLDNTYGKEIMVTFGWYDEEKGKFNKIVSKTGAANTDELIMTLTSKEFAKAKGDIYVQISANGKSANSLYELSFDKISSIANNNNKDNTSAAAVALIVGSEVSNWVGLGDNADYYKLDFNASGIYSIAVDDAENPLKVQLFKSVNGKLTAVKSISLTAAKDSGLMDDLLLDADSEYYLAVTGTGAAKGQNSDYTVKFDGVVSTESAMNFGDVWNLENVTRDGSSMILATPEDGGAYKFTLNAAEAAGSLKLTVYELLTTGKTRTVKTITVKAGAEGTTGYLYLDDTVAKNGTGVYQVKVTAANASSGGDCSVSLEGYEFSTHLAAKDAPIEQGVKNWVGPGDASDSMELIIAEEAAGVRSLNLTGINGNNLKLVVVNKATGKTVKTFTPASGAESVSFGYEFDAGKYEIRVEAASGNNKFSEYTLDIVDRTIDIARQDNGFDDNVDTLVVSGEQAASVDGWVGLGDAKDYYLLSVDETGNYNIDLSGLDNNVKIVLYNSDRKQIKSLTATPANGTSGMGEMFLEKDSPYYVMLQATSTKGTKDSEYSLNVEQAWAFEADAAANDTVGAAYENGAVSGTVTGSVVYSQDKVDYYMVEVAADGSYTLKLDGINGNTIAAFIGTMDSKGNFKSLQKVTGKAGENSLTLERELAAGTYYVKIESVVKNTASKYEMSFAETERNAGYSNDDDTWKLVAGDINAKRYGVGETLNGWVGKGDTADVFKFSVDENGVVSFEADDLTRQAVQAKQMSLTLLDAQGKSVAIAFDAESGNYMSKTNLMADVEYYLSIKHNKATEDGVNYSIAIK